MTVMLVATWMTFLALKSVTESQTVFNIYQWQTVTNIDVIYLINWFLYLVHFGGRIFDFIGKIIFYYF